MNRAGHARQRAAALVLVLLCGSIAASALHAAPQAQPPNIVFILVDDLRQDELDYPFVEVPNIQRLAAEGVRFTNAFVTTPLCSPSRASFLTGRYAHAHGITDNTERSARSHELVTFPRLLQQAGYETAFVGKWHMGVDDARRPGIDHWVSVPGQGRYFDPEFNVNGTRQVVAGYFTDLLSDFAVEFIERERDRPFLLYLSHKAVHPDTYQAADGSVDLSTAENFQPAPRHARLYAGATIPHRANYGIAPVNKPALLRTIAGVAPLGPDTVTGDEVIRNRLRVLAPVDEGVGRILAALEAQGALENTVIVFTSDEGYFYGEHGLSVERRLAYEESIRIPLLVRWPARFPPGMRIEEMALGIDIAPTLLQSGAAPVADDMHGRSLVPLLRGDPVAWRDSFLIEYFSDTVFPRIDRMGYQAVRTERWKYIHYVDLEGMDELYDLHVDPYELDNVIDEAAARPTLQSMRTELERLLSAAR